MRDPRRWQGGAGLGSGREGREWTGLLGGKAGHGGAGPVKGPNGVSMGGAFGGKLRRKCYWVGGALRLTMGLASAGVTGEVL